MIKVIRYSKTAFQPQYQDHHLASIDYELYYFDINSIPKHLQTVCKERHKKILKFYLNNLDDLARGVWVFIDGYKNNQSLNHLKEKVPCWEAELPDDTIVYGVNWDKKFELRDSEAKIFGVFVPESELSKIQNIKHRSGLK